jgi:hypothetical protein
MSLDLPDRINSRRLCCEHGRSPKGSSCSPHLSIQFHVCLSMFLKTTAAI